MRETCAKQEYPENLSETRAKQKFCPNGPQTDSNGVRTEPERTLNGSRTDSERTLNGPVASAGQRNANFEESLVRVSRQQTCSLINGASEKFARKSALMDAGRTPNGLRIDPNGTRTNSAVLVFRCFWSLVKLSSFCRLFSSKTLLDQGGSRPQKRMTILSQGPFRGV